MKFVRDILATKRLTRLLIEDVILEDFRETVFRKWDPAENKLGYLLTCSKCASVWLGALVVSGIIPDKVLDLLAYSEATVIAGDIVDALGKDD